MPDSTVVNDNARQAFELEIRAQAWTAARAFHRVELAAAQQVPGTLNPAREAQLSAVIQDSLSQFFSAIGVIAKILDPHPRQSDPKRDLRKLRGEALRSCLRVELSLKLLDRDVRDGLEHIDEKIEDWVDGPGRLYVSWIVTRNLSGAGSDAPHSMRHFNSATFEFRVGNSSGNLRDLMKELRELDQRLTVQEHVLAMSVEDPTSGKPTETIVSRIPNRPQPWQEERGGVPGPHLP